MSNEKRQAIVTTTIHVPKLLEKYVKNLSFYGHHEITFIVIGDQRTPSAAEKFCKDLDQKSEHHIIYFSVERQEEYLRQFPKFKDFLPWNCIQRRNVGMLYAYENDFDVITTIDDDNIVTNDDFLGNPGHGMTGKITQIIGIESSSGWFNPCSLLEEKNHQIFYHRGHPLSQRGNDEHEFITKCKVKGKIAVNAGLWLDDPDIDAITRMNFPICVTGMKTEIDGNIALMPGTWAPFNSQNTSLAREVIPAYFLSPHVGRYDDIWASYIIKRIADHLNHLISYGHPLVRQTRNEHDLFKDLDQEIMGMELTDQFCDFLRNVELSGQSYYECYYEIIQHLDDFLKINDQKMKKYQAALSNFLKGMKVWNELFEAL